MQAANLVKKIDQIKITCMHLVDDILAGAYRSAFKGSGMEFEEVRPYQAGDEVRSIDWNVTARMGQPYVKHFREERELTVMLLVDISSSTRFGSIYGSKNSCMAEIAALLAFSAIKNNDKVGLLLFDQDVVSYLSPKKGTRHVLRVIRELLLAPAVHKTTNLQRPLAFLGKVLQRRALCFLLSDFMCADFAQDVAISAKRHELIAMAITDVYEAVFPNLNLAYLSDLETGTMHIVDTSFKALSEHTAAQEEKRLADLKMLFTKCGGDFVHIRTDRPYVETLRRFFRTRHRR